MVKDIKIFWLNWNYVEPIIYNFFLVIWMFRFLKKTYFMIAVHMVIKPHTMTSHITINTRKEKLNIYRSIAINIGWRESHQQDSLYVMKTLILLNVVVSCFLVQTANGALSKRKGRLSWLKKNCFGLNSFIKLEYTVFSWGCQWKEKLKVPIQQNLTCSE